MTQTRKRLLLALLAACLCSVLATVMTLTKGLAAETGLALRADERGITLTGAAETLAGKTGTLVRFKPNQYHCSEDFLAEYDGAGDDNPRDGYTTDRAYYSTAQAGIAEGEIPVSGTLTIPRFSSLAAEEGYDKIYDKFYIVEGGTVAGGMLTGGTALAGPFHVTEFPSERDFENTTAGSIKGLEIMNADDAENLGISHGAVTFDLPGLLMSSTAKDAIRYTVNGKDYYFSENYLKAYDKKVMDNTEAGIKTTFVMVIWRTSISRALPELVHPDNTTSNVNSLSIVAPNLTTQAGIDAHIAMYEFLAERYTREDAEYGRVSYFVIGNETDAAYEWNNMGYLPLDEYMRQYERTVRAAYTAIRKHWKNAGVFISTTHFWNRSTAEQFGITEYVDKGAFTSRQILDSFAALAKKQGDFGWELAYHPYRATHMGEPVFWDEINVNEAPHNAEAAKITPLNIEVLGEYLRREELLYRGRPRNFYLTESGVASPHEPVRPDGSYDSSTYDPEKIPEEALAKQAAAYAYTYYSFLFSGAKSYIFHRHTDVIGENGVNIGIWMRSKGSDDLYAKKPVWEVMKYIDTSRSLEVTEPYLKYITLYPSQTPAKSWQELIPNFDPDRLEQRPLPLEREAELADDAPPGPEALTFEDGSLGDWVPTGRATSAQIFEDESLAAAGKNFLLVRYNNNGRMGGGFAEKGIGRFFEAPMDLSGMSDFRFAIRVSKLKVLVDYDVKVRFYSGDSILESRVKVKPDEWQTVRVDLAGSGWQGLERVDKIKIWFSVQNNTTEAGTIGFDNIGFLRAEENAAGGCQGCAGDAAAAALVIGAAAGAAAKRFL